MSFAQVNGQKLYYEDAGGDDPAVVFSHGLLMDHEMFAPQVAVLKDHYRCITWDERGHGNTARDTLEPFTYYDSANDLAALLEHLGVKRAVLVGMSQGGYLSLRCALTQPSLVRGLVLIDTQAGLEDPALMPGHKQQLDAWITGGLSETIADNLEHAILGQSWSGATAWRRKWRDWKPANLLQCFQTLASRDDLLPKLHHISVPTLVIHGNQDVAIDLERGRLLARGLPQAELAVISGGGHASNLTHADQVNPYIERFLNNLPN